VPSVSVARTVGMARKKKATLIFSRLGTEHTNHHVAKLHTKWQTRTTWSDTTGEITGNHAEVGNVVTVKAVFTRTSVKTNHMKPHLRGSHLTGRNCIFSLLALVPSSTDSCALVTRISK
jgi:hypothetical protein